MIPDISTAKDPDLPASLIALRRAGELARTIAIQTNTAIVVWEDGKIVKIPAEVLKAERDGSHPAAPDT